MPRYKCRLECFYDVITFLEKLRNYNNELRAENRIRLRKMKMEQDDLLGGEFEFDCDLKIKFLIDLINDFNCDLHVMAQTLMPIAKYTGIRNFDV